MIWLLSNAKVRAKRARHRRRRLSGMLFGGTRGRSLRGRRIVILPGQYLDEETGLIYNYFREYDAATGGYVESDPIGTSGGVNSFLYGLANALQWTDRYGLLPDCVYEVLRVERRRKLDTERDVWGYRQSVRIGSPEGIGLAPDLDPRFPKKPPIAPSVEFGLFLLTHEYGNQRTYLSEQLIEHLRAFCSYTTETCSGDEERVTMEPFDTQRTHGPIRTLIDEGHYDRIIKILALTVSVSL